MKCIASWHGLVRSALLLFAGFSILGGCGGTAQDPNRVYVHGRVTSAGEPLQVEGFAVGIGAVRVAFYPIVGGKTAVAAADETGADEEGNFKIRDGLAPGEYRIVVEQWDPHPNVEKLKGKFNLRNSPIVRTISHDQDFIEIDLANEAGDSDN